MAFNRIHDFILQEDCSKAYFDSVIKKLTLVSSIALFGAGQGGVRTYEFLRQHGLHLRVAYFIDNNPRKQGCKMSNEFGTKIIGLEDFCKFHFEDYMIVLLSNKNIGNLVMLKESGDLIRRML